MKTQLQSNYYGKAHLDCYSGYCHPCEGRDPFKMDSRFRGNDTVRGGNDTVRGGNDTVRGNAKRRDNTAGFTLIEVMVVVVILGILAAIIVPKIMSRPEQARIVKVKQDILAIQGALDLYKLDNGFYPTTDQGLQALVSKPTTPPEPRNWKSDGYLEEVPLDPWGEAYQYANDDEKVRISSFGPKGRDGNSEIGNWNMNDQQSA